jgi:hypothetical protein
MGFMDEARAAMPQKGPRCKVCVALEVVDAKTRSEVDAVMADPNIYSTAIRSAMVGRGWDVGGVDNVRRHRNGECVGRTGKA